MKRGEKNEINIRKSGARERERGSSNKLKQKTTYIYIYS